MRKVFFISAVAAIVLVSACHKPGSQGTMTLKFNPTFGAGNNILRYKTYQSPDGKYYNFQDFKFYLSHIKVIKSNGSAIEVAPIAYFSIDDSTDVKISVTVPAGNFTGIQFNIGLDSAQNAILPSSDPANPLSSNNNTWWTLQTAFVFVEVDGTADTVANSSNGIAYHVGTNPYYTLAPMLAQNFSISGDKQTILTLNVDAQKIFYNPGGDCINILTDPTTMTTGSPYTLSLARTFMNDFSQVFSLSIQ